MDASTPDSAEEVTVPRGEKRRDDHASTGGSKRPRKGEDEHIPQRRQAACQPCRMRKIKCDKRKPFCNICVAGGQECEYLNETTDKLTLESATSTILEKFEELKHELHTVKRALHETEATTPRSFQSSIDTSRISRPPKENIESSRDFLQIPPHRASADAVLTWEVFGDRFPNNALIGSLFDDATRPDHTEGLVSAPVDPKEIEGEVIVALIDRFLQNVHTKNPILDVEALIKHSRHCAEHGLGWDARSCLILMTCALGAVAKPFGETMPPNPGAYTSPNEPYAYGQQPISSAAYCAEELEQGEACFTLACRRLGSLKYSLLGAHCYFFAGVYLMYTLRPLDSWHYFLQASIFFQIHLKSTHGVGGDLGEALASASRNSSSNNRKIKRLEQSMYWSCFKSECEFRVELPLNQSEISLSEYPDLFPSPPSPMASPTARRSAEYQDEDEEFELRQHAVRLCNEEESWYYYLTEIALRRIGNRIVNTFFRQHRTTWLTGIKPLLRMAREFEAQVSSWSAHLPPAMQRYQTHSVIRAPHLNFDEPEDASDPSGHVSRELSWAVDNRLLEMQTWLYQPFLYYLIHSDKFASMAESPGNPALLPAENMTYDEMQVLRELISAGIGCCIKTIEVRCRGHRHHGLWFDLRSLMTASLVLLAIVKSRHADWIPGGLEALWGRRPANSWTGEAPAIGGMLGMVLTQFAYWSAEAPDMDRYKTVLERLVRQVRGA